MSATSEPKTTVLIVGATGNTGASVVNGLLESNRFNVIAGVRTQSLQKPEVLELQKRGVEIRALDLEEPVDQEQLQVALKGVDTVVSTITYYQLELQRALIDPAKKAGVKRFVPCDWGTACVPGVRKMYDQKLAIHDAIKQAGLGYTFIDVGWWFQITLPILDIAKSPYEAIFPMMKTSQQIYGTGNVKNAVTDREDIGKFVARILDDPRTQDRYVFCWTEEVTQRELHDLAARLFGKEVPAEYVSEEELKAKIKDAEGIIKAHYEYELSMYIRGDNVVANAKKEEYGQALDARELYPDLKLRSLEDFAKEYYQH